MDSLNLVIAAIGATGAFGLTAMSLVDVLKTLPEGGVSKIGFRFLAQVFDELEQPLKRAMGEGWKSILLAHWINGRPRAEQIGAIRAMIRLGLDEQTAQALAPFGGVKAEVLKTAAEKLARGEELDQTHVNAIGRVEAAVEARLDGAFDRADQAYRNWSRVLAGGLAVLLAIAVWGVLVLDTGEGSFPVLPANPNTFFAAVLVGVLAVPIAPIAKDLVGALTAASKAVQATRRP